MMLVINGAAVQSAKCKNRSHVELIFLKSARGWKRGRGLKKCADAAFSANKRLRARFSGFLKCFSPSLSRGLDMANVAKR